LGHVGPQRGDDVLAGLGFDLQDHECDNCLAGGLVLGPDHGGLGHVRVGDQGGFDLGGGQAVPGDVHDVVHAAQQPDVPVLVLLGTVPGEVHALEAGPVGLLVAVHVAPDAAQHPRPGVADDQEAALAVAHGLAGLVDDVHGDARD